MKGGSMEIKLPDLIESGEYIRNCQPVWLLAPAAYGKTTLCSKIAWQARALQYSAHYYSTPDFFRQCSGAEQRGISDFFFASLCRANLIILDDFLTAGITFSQVEFLYKLLEYPVDPEHPRSILISSLRKEERIKQILTDAAPILAESIIAHLRHHRILLTITWKDRPIIEAQTEEDDEGGTAANG